MKRREFIKKAAAGVAASTVFGPVYAQTRRRFRLRMATSWPKSLDTIFGGAQDVADFVKAATDGMVEIRPFAANEIVGALQVFDAVQQGTVDLGHTASYYYVGKSPAFAFDTALPFGLTFRQQNAWWYFGGGGEVMNRFYAEFGVIGFPAGNTGVQMGGWFRREINDLEDLKGLKMRIPGLGGQVMSRLGVDVQVLGAPEIFPALERGVIDATEWVGPYDDEKLGFNKVAQFYYYPGWWEPAPQLNLYINLKTWESLPKEVQEAIRSAAAAANVRMMAKYDAQNPAALRRLLAQGTKLRKYPNDVLREAEKQAFEMYEELASQDKTFREIFEGWKKFREETYRWHATAELSYAQFAFPKV